MHEPKVFLTSQVKPKTVTKTSRDAWGFRVAWRQCVTRDTVGGQRFMRMRRGKAAPGKRETEKVD